LQSGEVGFDPVAELVFNVCQSRRSAPGVRDWRFTHGNKERPDRGNAIPRGTQHGSEEQQDSQSAHLKMMLLP
jgi:hypothetical protein